MPKSRIDPTLETPESRLPLRPWALTTKLKVPNPWPGDPTIPLAGAVYGLTLEWYTATIHTKKILSEHPAASRWWKKQSMDTNWCGVFQGGGAKAAAYAGAILGWMERGHWFSEVAGSSAGAITASLIAAGLHPKEIVLHTENLISKAATPSSRLDRVLNGSPLTRPLMRYSLIELEKNLESLLAMGARRHGIATSAPVTFAQLYQATGIRLTVVVLDTSSGRPLPFSEQWSPDMPVATAVCASSSIPVVFEPLTLEVNPSRGDRWRRLADGGIFANFPSFVYIDLDYRRFFGLGEISAELRIVGFVLGEPELDFDVPRPRRFVTRPKNVLPLSAQLKAERSSVHYQTVRRMAAVRGMVELLHGLDLIDEADAKQLYSRAYEHYLKKGRWMLGLLTGLMLQVAAAGVLLWLLSAGIEDAISGSGLTVLVVGICCTILVLVVRRLIMLITGESLQVLRVWSGLALKPPIWIGTGNDSAFVVDVPVTMLNTASFRAPIAHVRISVFLGYVLTSGAIERITEGSGRGRSTDVTFPGDPNLAEDYADGNDLPSHPYRRPRRTRFFDFLTG